jgi:hypothetical protein
MNVSAVANGQYATYQSGICNKISDFNEFLQKRLQESQGSSPQPSGQATKANLMHIMLIDMSGGQPVYTKRPDIPAEDMELMAYAKQLAVELGLDKEKIFGPNNEILFKPRTGEFMSALQELLDNGSISREDIINAVKHPPKIRLEEYRHIDGRLDGEPLGNQRMWNIRPGFERYSVGINYKDFETTEPIAFSSASELFEIIWGKKTEAKTNNILLPEPPRKILPNFTSGIRPDLEAIAKKEPSPAPQKEQTAQPSFRETMFAHLMNDIIAALSKKGITLSPSEKFNINVDKLGNITITGNDEQKAKAIENVLNSSESKNWGLLLQKRYMEDMGDVFNPSKEHADKINKMLLENYIAKASGGTTSLDSLYLLDNGRIMGLPPELDELINSTKPAYYGKTRQDWEKQVSAEYDFYKELEKSSHIIYDISNADEALKAYNAGNKEEYVRIIVDGLIEEAKFADVKTTLTEILKKGVNNIPDTTDISMVLW